MTDDDLTLAGKDLGAFAQSMLQGPDRAGYCDSIKKVVAAGGAGHLNVPIDLVAARDVDAALLPYLRDLASLAATHPGANRLRASVVGDIDRIVLDERLATILDDLANPLGGHALTLPKPDRWTPNWPPSAKALGDIAGQLRHIAANAVRICDLAPPVDRSANQIATARALAQSLANEATKWANDFPTLLKASALQTLPSVAATIPAVVQEPLAPGAPAAPAQMHVVLIPWVNDPTTYSIAVAAQLTDIRGATHPVEWPLGAEVHDVRLGPDGKPFFNQNALAPNLPLVDETAAKAALDQIGLPSTLVISGQVDVTVSGDFSKVTMKVPVTFGPYFSLTLDLDLVKDGISRIDKALADALDQIKKGLPPSLRAHLPALSFVGQALELADPTIDVDKAMTHATVAGTVHLGPLGSELVSGQPLAARIVLDVPLDGSVPRVVEASWLNGGMANIRAALQTRLQATGVGLSQCIGIADLSLKLESKNLLVLTTSLTVDGKPQAPRAIASGDPLKSLLDLTVSLTGDKDVQQCVALLLLDRIDPKTRQAAADLATKTVSIAGFPFAVRNSVIDTSAAKPRFRADLVATDGSGLSLTGVTVDATWRAGSALPFSTIHVEGATLPPALVDRIISSAEPTLHTWIAVDKIAYGHGVLTIAGTLTVPGITDPVPFDDLPLDLDQAATALRVVIEGAVKAALGKAINTFSQQIAAQVGAVDSIALDEGDTVLHDGQLWFKVSLKVSGFDNIKIPVKVQLLPKFMVKADGNPAKALLDASLGEITEALGAIGSGDGIGNVRALIDTQENRFGVIFDVGVMVAEIVRVKAQDLVLDQHGMSVPDSVGIGLPALQILLPPTPLEISNLSGMIWLHPAGRFSAHAALTLDGDDTGLVIRVDGTVTGDPYNRSVGVEGGLSVLTIPMFQTDGNMDFGQGKVTVDAKTTKAIASILNLNGRAEIAHGDLTASAGLASLGLKAAGMLDVHLEGDKTITLEGQAEFSNLGNARVGFKTAKDFSSPNAEGQVDIDIIRATAGMSLGVSYASLKFKWLGIGITVVTPSVASINNDLIESIISSLFDFKLELKDLKLNEITISLLDKNGKPTDGSYGGGSAPGDQQNRNGGGDQKPKAVDQGSSTGDSAEAGPAPEICQSRTLSNEQGPRIWLTNQVGSGFYVEAIHGSKYNYLASDSRIVSDAGKNLLAKSAPVDCVYYRDYRTVPFSFTFPHESPLEIENDNIAIVVPNGEPGQLMGVQLYKGAIPHGANPFPITLSSDEATEVFGSGGLTAAANWKRSSDYQQRLLSFLVEAQLDGIVVNWTKGIKKADIVPRWSGQDGTIVDQTTRGKETILFEDQNFREVSLPADSPLLSLLHDAPKGTIASLVASVPDKSSLMNIVSPPINLRPDVKNGCRIALIDEGYPDAHYAVAVEENIYSVLHLANTQTQKLAAEGWLDDSCRQMAEMGQGGELIIGPQSFDVQAGIKSDTWAAMIAARVVSRDQGKPTVWWLAAGTKPTRGSATITGEICASDTAFRSNIEGQVTDVSVMDWSNETDGIDAILTDLISDRQTWLRHFHVNPRGFLHAANVTIPCPAAQRDHL